jgi:hypothetical protein
MRSAVVVFVLAGVALGCSSTHRASLSPTPTTIPDRPTTTTAAQVTQRTTPPSSGYFQVAQVTGRTSASARCHTLPTTLDCLTLGDVIGNTQDLVDYGQPYHNSYGDWTVAIRITPRLVKNFNRNLHRQLAFIVDGTVPEIVDLVVPISAPEFGINVGPQQSAVVTLVDNLRTLRHAQP